MTSPLAGTDPISLVLSAYQANCVGQRGIGVIRVRLHVRILSVLRFRTTFARRKKQIGFHAMLLRVKLVIASACGVQRGVGPALNDAASLYHQDLIAASHGG